MRESIPEKEVAQNLWCLLSNPLRAFCSRVVSAHQLRCRPAPAYRRSERDAGLQGSPGSGVCSRGDVHLALGSGYAVNGGAALKSCTKKVSTLTGPQPYGPAMRKVLESQVGEVQGTSFFVLFTLQSLVV